MLWRMFADEMATRLTVRDFSSKFDLHAITEGYKNTAAAAPSGANQ